MFRRQEGFLGCVMLRSDTEAMVLTLWGDAAAVAALDASPTYKETVARILGADLLAGPQAVAFGMVHLSDLEAIGASTSSAEGPHGGG